MKISNKEKPIIHFIEVTGMEANKRRLIFLDAMNKNGFLAFIKHTQNNQTYYIFVYEKSF